LSFTSTYLFKIRIEFHNLTKVIVLVETAGKKHTKIETHKWQESQRSPSRAHPRIGRSQEHPERVL
jgi:hypothetical protein